MTFTFQPGRIEANASIGSTTPGGRRIAAQALRKFIERSRFLIRNDGDESRPMRAQPSGSRRHEPVDAPGSLFAPIVAAVPPGTEWSGFGNH